MSQIHIIADGGNAFRLPYETLYSDWTGINPVMIPAAHQKIRQRDIEKPVDTRDVKYQGSQQGGSDSDKPLRVANGDSLYTHFAGQGWFIEKFVVVVKRPGVGTWHPQLRMEVLNVSTGETEVQFVPLINPVTGNNMEVTLDTPGHYVGYVYTDGATGGTVNVPTVTWNFPQQSIPIAGTSTQIGPGTLTLTGRSVAIPGVAAGGYMLEHKTYVGGEVETPWVDDETHPQGGYYPDMDTCLAAFLSFGDYVSEHGCSCAPIPCDTEFPDPSCAHYQGTPISSAT